ncbi:MAG: DNA polymerase III subunit gamma/tau [Candidatus Cryptobacteroides sp.]
MPETPQYIVSARKYRPDSFESLIGQDNIVQMLKNSIIRGKLGHAYLFCGPRGVGKTSAARIFAKIINCSSPTPEMEPCGHCESCISFQEGRSYCIHELDAASNNGVDDIKALIDQVQIPPQVGRYSVYIIDEVHMLSQAAFNSFLKTLEEPPAHAIFILATTEKHKILPTILSRCQTYDFNRISIRDIVSNLNSIAEKEGIRIDDRSLHIIARKADGAMRDALTIFDQTVAFCGTDIKYEDVTRNLNVLDYEHCFRLTGSMLANDYQSALLEFDNVLSKGFNALYFTASLSTHFRNLVVAKSGSLDALLDFPDSLKKEYKEQADKCPLQFLYDALSITVQCESGYKESINPRLHIEFALMKLCFLTGGPVSLRPAYAAPVQSASPVQSAAPAWEAAPTRTSAPSQSSVSARGTSSQAVAGKADTTVSEPAVSGPAAAPSEENTSTGARNVSDALTEESARPRRRSTRSSAANLSIDAIKEDSGIATAQSAAGPSDIIPEDADIMEKWKQLPADYASRPRLANTLATSKVDILLKEGYKQLDFYVVNLAQKKWVEEVLLRELEGKLQKSLNSSKLRLNVEVIPEEQVEKKIYMPEDKAKVIMSENEEVKNLVNDFGLDVK